MGRPVASIYKGGSDNLSTFHYILYASFLSLVCRKVLVGYLDSTEQASLLRLVSFWVKAIWNICKGGLH